MYRPVILANTGEFGGSTVQAPFSKHQRTSAHMHGNQQIAISIFEIDRQYLNESKSQNHFLILKQLQLGTKEGRKGKLSI